MTGGIVMAFIIKKQSKVNGTVHYLHYLVVGYREGNKVKQRTVFRLGEYPTFDTYLKAKNEEQQRVKNEISRLILSNKPSWLRNFWLNKLPRLEKEYQAALAVKQKYVVE
jgi:hypothetical protein